jgi:DNA repair protein RecO (recombination protein O)
MPRFKEQAIVIRELDWSETSQIVTVLTQMRGKVRGLAKGSKRTSPSAVARYSGGFELLTLGQIVATIKPTAELATITEWDLQETWRHFRTDLAAQRMGLYAADLANALLADHDPHPGTFAALRAALAGMVHPGAGGRGAALLLFQWQLLTDCGFKPELENDVRTGAELEPAAVYAFDPRAGGLTGEISAGTTAGGAEDGIGPWRVRRDTVEVLRDVARYAAVLREMTGQATGDEGATADANEPSHAPLPSSGMGESGDEATVRANRLLCVYFRTILDRELPTMAFVLGS